MFNYEKYYESLAPIYNQVRLDQTPDFNNTLSMILSQCTKNVKNILDIGCGTGRYGQALCNKGFTVTGIDKSVSQLKQAQKVINAIEADALCLPFKNNSFDICTMIMMIHHIKTIDRKTAFSEAHRVLKDSGCLVIKTCSTEDLHKRLANIFFPETLASDLERYPDIDELIMELNSFFSVTVHNAEIAIAMKKEKVIHNFLCRKSSNLGMLTEKQLLVGIEKLEKFYEHTEIIERNAHNTFLIAKKGI